ncbi:MAG: Obg family GTPase CgtA [Actinomycetota bacterium]
MADVALGGFPNSGKCTFISAVSAAKPKIANYPFTTLEPHLGVVRLDSTTEFVLADIPGIIEGASDGKGLGHQFLRHIERARVLCILLDLAPMDGISATHQLDILLRELQAHKSELLDRPRLVVGTKSDVADAQALADWPGDRMSAVTGDGVRPVLGKLADLVKQARVSEPPQQAPVILRPEPEGTHVERVADNEFRLTGRAVERAVALNDVHTPDALNYIDERLKNLGVPRLLARAGAGDGAVVWIGQFSFDYVPEQ